METKKCGYVSEYRFSIFFSLSGRDRSLFSHSGRAEAPGSREIGRGGRAGKTNSSVLFSHRKTIGKWWFSMRFNGVIPGNDCDIAIEHGQSKVREFSHENWWICWLCKRLPEGRNTINSH